MKKWSSSFVSIFFVALTLLLSGCEDAVQGPPDDNSLSISDGARGATKAGWQLVNTIQTQGEFADAVAGSPLEIDDVPQAVVTMHDLNRYSDRTRRVYEYARRSGELSKVHADSLIWSEQWDDPVSGTAGRRALYYDAETGIARIFEVISQFPAAVEIDYDSTEIRVNVGPSLEDDTDDRLLSLNKLTLFNPGFYIERVEGAATVSEWDADNEPIAASVSNVVNYGTQTELEKLTETAEWSANNTAMVTERLDYRDNTFLQRSVTFNANFTGSFSESWRDGTTANGTFDLLENDNHAELTRTVNFASNPYLTRLEQAAVYDLDPADSSSHAVLSGRVLFNSGALDTSRVEIDHRRNSDGFLEDEYDIATSNDGTAHLLVTDFETYVSLAGEHEAVDGHFSTIEGTEYKDGSGQLTLKVWTNRQSYTNGEPPLVVIVINYKGDGTAAGTLAEGGETYNISYGANGEIEVRDQQGNSLNMAGY